MNWVLDHLQFIIAAAAAIAYWVNLQRGAAAREERKDLAPPTVAEAEEAERTRRIQEEIRRKIADRRGGETPPPVITAPTQERPLASPVLAPRPVAAGGGLREILETKLAQAQAREKGRIAARDRKENLEAQLRKLETERLAAERRSAEISLAARAENKASAVAQTAADVLAARSSRAWLDDLRNPHSAQRAVVLREVLGAPVGLR